jgi:cytoskeletal protein RodZ
VNQLNPVQLEQLKEIGAYLRQLRQEQSISREEVAARTFIPSRLLNALEEGQSEQLPEPVFIQGFIRRYADAINLDGVALAKSFPVTFSPVKPDTFQELPDLNAKPIAIESINPYVLYSIIGVVAASGLLYVASRVPTTKVSKQANSSLIVEQQTISQPKVSQSASPLQVTLSVTDRSWLDVNVDGKTEFKGLVAKGAKQTWKAKKQLTIKAGNMGAVLVSVNQQKAKVFRDLTKGHEVTLTSDKVVK